MASRLLSSVRPIVLEIDARSWLARLSRREGCRVRLGDVPEAELDAQLACGADALWLMGVWRTGPEGRRVARARSDVMERARRALPDLRPADVTGSPYAIREVVVAREHGGDSGLAELRARLAQREVGLILDLVPNHTAIDHPWVREHPEWYVQGRVTDAAAEPDAWFRIPGERRDSWLAHGRDPSFPAWRDTAQLDHRVPAVRDAMSAQLVDIGSRCDGVRCDMAMLVLDAVFRDTWADNPASVDVGAGSEFWSAAIERVRRRFPEFVLVAEAYWDLEYRLQQLGFDYTYDKRLLDRLASGPGEAVVGHLRADLAYQERSLRFLENHDEKRAAASMGPARQRSAALIVATVPGMLLLHDGQLDGARVRMPVEVARRPDEEPDMAVRAFYDRLLAGVSVEPFRSGSPIRLAPRASWDGDATFEAMSAWLWSGHGSELCLAVANLGSGTGRCFVPLQLSNLTGERLVFEDLLSDARYERDGSDLQERGLYLELPPDGYHLFRIIGHAPDQHILADDRRAGGE